VASDFTLYPGTPIFIFNEKSFGALARLRAMEHDTGIPAVRLAIAWVLAHPTVSSVLCGARTISHLENALAAMEVKLADY
jgi:aryl-alcohol dehydrogenase (NADP+)